MRYLLSCIKVIDTMIWELLLKDRVKIDKVSRLLNARIQLPQFQDVDNILRTTHHLFIVDQVFKADEGDPPFHCV